MHVAVIIPEQPSSKPFNNFNSDPGKIEKFSNSNFSNLPVSNSQSTPKFEFSNFLFHPKQNYGGSIFAPKFLNFVTIFSEFVTNPVQILKISALEFDTIFENSFSPIFDMIQTPANILT